MDVTKLWLFLLSQPHLGDTKYPAVEVEVKIETPDPPIQIYGILMRHFAKKTIYF